MKNVFIVISDIIKILAIILGFLTLFIIFHEVYHLHNGNAVGICIGNCNIYGEFSPAVSYFEDIKEKVPINEEVDACAFAFVCTLFILMLYLIGGFLLDRHQNR